MPDERKRPTPDERDEPVEIDLDPDDALRGLLTVDPKDEPVPADRDQASSQGDPLRRATDPPGEA